MPSEFAIIQFQGRQHLVHVGDKIKVNLVDSKVGDLITPEVLLYAQLKGDKMESEVGAPVLKSRKVSLKVLKHFKDEKVRVVKFRAKSRYRRTYGHRDKVTLLEVVEIK